MLLSEITHKATLKSIETNNLDISIFENIDQLRKHLKQIIRLRFRETHGIVSNPRIRKFNLNQEYQKEYQKEYVIKYKDRLTANRKNIRIRNKEHIRQWYIDNKERLANKRMYKQILKMIEKDLPLPQNLPSPVTV